MIKSIIKYSLATLLLIAMCSYQSAQKTKQQLIEEALEAKILKFKFQEDAKCLKKALEAAEINVDSIISIELGAMSTDSVSFPSKPVKPKYESFDSLRKDDVDLIPLFDSLTSEQPLDSIH